MELEIRQDDNDNTYVNIKNAPYFWYIKYLDGYFTAICELKSVLVDQKTENVIYPLLFSLSHYMEVFIKVLVLCVKDTSTSSECKINTHNVFKIINDNINIFSKYGISRDDLLNIKNEYEYFLKFDLNKSGKDLPMIFKYPLDINDNVIVNLDTIEEQAIDNYKILISKIDSLLSSTNLITRKFFYMYFTEKFEEHFLKEGDSYDQL